MNYEIKHFSSHGTTYVRWAIEDERKALDSFALQYWDLKLVQVYGKPWFDLLLSPAAAWIASAGVDFDRRRPPMPARKTRTAMAAWREKNSYLDRIEREYPLLRGKLVVETDGTLDIRMPGIEKYGLPFVIRVRDAAERGVAAVVKNDG